MSAAKEQIRKAMACKTADELLALAKSWGVELTLEQAEEYIAKMKTSELTEEELVQAAGGYPGCWSDSTCSDLGLPPCPNYGPCPTFCKSKKVIVTCSVFQDRHY